MLDVSPNHMGSGPLSQINYQDYIPWNNERYFHAPRFGISYNPRNQTEIEQFWIGGRNDIALPDVNTELSEVVNTLYNWIKKLVKTYAVDGIRIDTAKHIRKTFWPGFCRASRVFAIGEVLDGDPEYAPPIWPC